MAETCQGDFWGAGPSARPPGLPAGTSPSACVWPQLTSSISTLGLVGEAGHTPSPRFQEGAGLEPSSWGGSSPGPRRGAPLPLTPPAKPTLTGPLAAGSVSGGPSPPPASLAHQAQPQWSPVINPGASLLGLQLEHTTLFCAPAGRKWTRVSLSRSQGSGRAGSPQRLQEGVCPLCFPNFVAHGLFLPPAPEPSIT